MLFSQVFELAPKGQGWYNVIAVAVHGTGFGSLYTGIFKRKGGNL